MLIYIYIYFKPWGSDDRGQPTNPTKPTTSTYSYHLRQPGWPAGIKSWFYRIRFLFSSSATGRAGNFSFYPRVPLHLTRCGAGAGRPFRKIQHADAGRVDSTRDGCGSVDLESRVPANPQKNKKIKKIQKIIYIFIKNI